MMKFIHCVPHAICAMTVAASMSLAGAQTSQDIAAALKAHIDVKTKAFKIDKNQFNGLLATDVFKVESEIQYPNSDISNYDGHAFMENGKLAFVERPTTTEKCPNLLKLIDPAFRLKTVDDAKKLVVLLDHFFPNGRAKRELEEIQKQHGSTILEQNGRFVILRGKFFKQYKGFYFDVDPAGKITQITHSLEIELKP